MLPAGLTMRHTDPHARPTVLSTGEVVGADRLVTMGMRTDGDCSTD